MSKEGDLTEGDGRGEAGNTLMHRMYIHKLIEVNYYAEHEKEGCLLYTSDAADE